MRCQGWIKMFGSSERKSHECWRDINTFFLLECFVSTIQKTNNSHTAVCFTSPSHCSPRTLLFQTLLWFSLTPHGTPNEVPCPTSVHPFLSVTHHFLLLFLPFFPLSSAPAPLPDCFQSFLREEALDFFCSQCHKQISRLEDLSTRLNFLEMTR